MMVVDEPSLTRFVWQMRGIRSSRPVSAELVCGSRRGDSHVEAIGGRVHPQLAPWARHHAWRGRSESVPSMTAPAIRTDQLTKRYGRVNAIDQLTIEVVPGEVMGYLGPN